MNIYLYLTSVSYRKHRWAAKNLWLFRLPHGKALVAIERQLRVTKVKAKVLPNGHIKFKKERRNLRCQRCNQ